MSADPRSDRTYSVNELADEAGVTRRTVHYYIAQGLLPTSGSEGRGTRYGQGHLDRLFLIRELQREHLPLAEIRLRVERLSDAQVAQLLAASGPAPEPQGTAFEYIQSVLAGTARRDLSVSSAGPAQGPAAAADAPPQSPALPSRPAAAAPAPAPSATPRAAETPGVYAPAMAEPVLDNVALTNNRSQWERIPLAPDVELHVRRPLSRITNRAVDHLVALARQLLEEDPS